MNAVLFDTGRPVTAYPLTCTRPLSACTVANRPIEEHLREAATAAGFSLDDCCETGRLVCFLPGDSWLSPALLQVLATAREPLIAMAAEGEPLAWVNLTSQLPSNARQLPASADCFKIRYPWDLLRLNELLLSTLTANDFHGEVSPATVVDGHLVVGTGSRILPGVFVEGNVIIGQNCKIGPNCYLRGTTSIGDNCHIGQAVEIKNSIIMNGASVGHLSYCGDSILGEKVNFGAGTITANLRHDGKTHHSMVGSNLFDTGRRKFGTVVGDGAHTGIHTSIYPGRKLWPHSATRPGEVVKYDVTEEGA